jgi:hemerythrin-like domain-containing protein
VAQKSTTMADSRDMIGGHDAFRREFSSLPDVIRTVAAGDTRRVVVVTDHIEFLTDFLHTHHSSEDELVWPKLNDRCPQDVRPVVRTMEDQHLQIDTALNDLLGAARRWKASGTETDRDAAAAAADRLLPPLNAHLVLEESLILPLIDQYLTDQEWKAVMAASTSKIAPGKRALALGMVLHGADDEMRALLREAIPTVLWLIFRPLAARAYRTHAKRLSPAGG